MASQIIAKAEAIPALSEFLYGMLNAAFHSSETQIFGKRKVREMLFDGYKVRAIEEMENLIKGIPNSPIPFKTPLKDNMFGLFIWVRCCSNSVCFLPEEGFLVYLNSFLLSLFHRKTVPMIQNRWTGESIPVLPMQARSVRWRPTMRKP